MSSAWRHYNDAVGAAHAARARFDAAVVDIERLRLADQHMPAWAHETVSHAGETQRISEAAAEVGIPVSSLLSVSVSTSPEATTKSPHPIRIDRLRATIAVSGITLPELGRFIAAWSETHPAWVVSAIDITPVQHQAAGGGRDLPLRVLLVLETMAAVPLENPA
jgi:hypothetical protein